MNAVPEKLDGYGRELPTDVAASVMWLVSMGFDTAAIALRDGWFGPIAVTDAYTGTIR